MSTKRERALKIICPVCKLLHADPTMHLKRKCMENSTDEERKVAHEQSRMKAFQFTRFQNMSADELREGLRKVGPPDPTADEEELVIKFLSTVMGIHFTGVPGYFAEMDRLSAVQPPRGLSPRPMVPVPTSSTVIHPEQTSTVTRPEQTSTVTRPEQTSTVTRPEQTSVLTHPDQTSVLTHHDIQPEVIPEFLPQPNFPVLRSKNQPEVVPIQQESSYTVQSTAKVAATDFNWKSESRKGLKEAGLADRVPIDDPVLVDLDGWLLNTMGKASIHARISIINHVARMHYFIQKSEGCPNPSEIDLQSLNQEVLDKFIRAFGEHCESGSIQSLEKHICTYLKYVRLRKDVRQDHKRLYAVVDRMISIRELSIKSKSQKTLHANLDKQSVDNLHEYRDVDVTIKQMRELVDDADLLARSMRTVTEGLPADLKVKRNNPVSMRYVELLRHMMSILSFKHFQRTGVTSALTVNNFLDGYWHEGRYFLGVIGHSTATARPAFFALSKQEYDLFNGYYKNVRVPDKNEARSAFFVKCCGKAYSNCTKEVHALQVQLKKTKVSTDTARHLIRNLSSRSDISYSEQVNISNYLAHSIGVPYRDLHVGEVVATINLIDQLIQTSTDSTNDVAGPSQVPTTSMPTKRKRVSSDTEPQRKRGK